MKWNFMALIIGPPEYGKTSILRALARRHLQEHEKGIVLLHDPVGQFFKDACVWYRDANAYRAAVRAAHEKKLPMPRGASIGGSDVELIRLAIEMGKRAGNTQWNVRLPIFVGFDETAMKQGSGATYVGDDDGELMTARRHYGIGIAINAQDGGMLMKRWLTLATDLYLMVQTEEDVLRIEKKFKLAKGSLVRSGATRLAMHNFLHVRHVVGVVGEKY